jgi:hypothetical protein
MMALTFALLMDPRVLNGLPFHEIAGLVLGVAILTHISLNFQWVKNTTLKIFDSKVSKKTRFSFLLNILLLISMSTIIITGIFISRVVFPNLALEGNHIVRGLHSLSANVTLALVGLHIGVHWQWVMGICKKMFKSKEGTLRKGVFVSALFSLVILTGGIQWVNSNLVQQENFGQPFNIGKTGYENNTENSSGEAFHSQGPQNRDFRGHHGGGDFGHRGASNPFLVILNYFLILAALIVPTYYLERKILRRKSNKKTPKLNIKDATS